MTATIHYYDIGDCLDREEKLEIIRNFKSIENVPWTLIAPNKKHDWINQRNDEFDSFTSLSANDQTEISVFEVQSNGIGTSRDAWCYNFSEKTLTKNIKRMIDFYNEQREALQEKRKYFPDTKVEEFIDNDSTKIAWSSSLKNYFERNIKLIYSSQKIVTSIYRPFCKSHVYFDNYLIHRVSQMPRIFPEPDTENMAISVEAPGGKTAFSILITNTLSDLHLFGATQCFPYYVYEPTETKTTTLLPEEKSGSGKRVGNYIRHENITDAALQKFRDHYKDNTITKHDIFYYVYGILNSREYQQRYSSELKKQLPRIPFANDFWGFSQAGRELAKLHLNYETLKKYPLKEKITGTINYHVTEMKFPSKTDKTKIIYNSTLTLENIPPETYQYIVNGKSALEWIMDRYKISTHKDSRITNDPNDWCNEHGNSEYGDPEYIVNLIKRIVYLSVESVKIIDALPNLGI